MSQWNTTTMISGNSTQLQIHQQNVNKSLVAQGDLLHRLDPKSFDIVAIQEPYLDCNHNTHANLHWCKLYPKEHYIEPEKTRSIIFINKQIATDSWIQVDFGLSDVTAVQVQTAVGVVLVINMYNQIAHTDIINWILQVMRTRGQGRSDMPNAAHTLWLGDFNRHHPLWDKSCNVHLFTKSNLDRAQELIDAIMELGLRM